MDQGRWVKPSNEIANRNADFPAGDFEDGLDHLSIRPPSAVTFEDLVITSFGASGQHTRITCENIVIELLNLDRVRIDASDLDLLLV